MRKCLTKFSRIFECGAAQKDSKGAEVCIFDSVLFYQRRISVKDSNGLVVRFTSQPAENGPLKVCQKLAKVRTKVCQNIARPAPGYRI